VFAEVLLPQPRYIAPDQSGVNAMSPNAAFAEIAALAGDPARAAMLNALMDGRALTASELAETAGVTPQTASGHLARLTTAGLLTIEKQGRHRYHRLATPDIAHMIEAIMQVASTLNPPKRQVVVGPRDAALRTARTCYDHLAGRWAVAVADALVAGGHVELDGDGGVVTGKGASLLRRLGVEVDGVTAAPERRPRRLLCRPCLDWSERRPHLAGAVGAALLDHFLDEGWVRRLKGTRAVEITPKGQRGFRETFGVAPS
jgi:DNA-binding transcriptional ArsR family regulator/ribosomal protein S19E (S16A)